MNSLGFFNLFSIFKDLNDSKDGVKEKAEKKIKLSPEDAKSSKSLSQSSLGSDS